MTTEITKQAQVILNWLKDPTTKRYIKKLLEDEENLSKIALVAMNNAISDGSLSRSEDEIKTFSQLKTTRILLNTIPYKVLSKEEIDEQDVKELESFFEQLPN